MTREDCERYLQDPEANAGHLAACGDCRAFFEGLEARAEETAVTVPELPLAPWEGAAHRAWPLVAGVAALVGIVAFTISAAAGTSPLHAFASALPPFDMLLKLMQYAGGASHNAPLSWQIGIGAAFVIVNTVLYLLLRRAPRGIDA